MGMLALMEMATRLLVLEQGIHLQAQTEFLMDIQFLRMDTQVLKVLRMDIKDHPMGIPDHQMDIQVLQTDTQVHPMDTQVHPMDMLMVISMVTMILTQMGLTAARGLHWTVTTPVTMVILSTMGGTDMLHHQVDHREHPKGNITTISPLPGRVRMMGARTITHPGGELQVTPLTFPIENTEDLPLNCTKNQGIHSHPTKMCQDR